MIGKFTLLCNWYQEAICVKNFFNWYLEAICLLKFVSICLIVYIACFHFDIKWLFLFQCLV